MTLIDDRPGQRPRELTAKRIAGRIESADRRAWWALCKALDIRDLAFVINQTETEVAQGNSMPWARVSLRAAKSELRRRAQRIMDL